jgi:2,3-bisphosphoglycerate-independent phosphoglycerate mutase
MANRPRPLVVVILDGWGISFLTKGNAILAASTPNMNMFSHYYPVAALQAASMEVGLPWGEVGNSETGHRNIGAGHVEYQVLPLIDKAIADGSFQKNTVWQEAIAHAQQNNSALHLMGLVSPGGVHSHMNHLFALIAMAARAGLNDRVYIHMFTDGRDTLPQSALEYVTKLEDVMGKYACGKIASVTGRLYAMDRNQNWERTEATYNMLTGGKRTAGAASARQAIEQAYGQHVFDEMIPPTAITRGGEALATIQDNDAVIFFNFRPDRARQLTQTFVQPQQVGFPVKPLQNIYFATMAQYHKDLPAPAAFVETKAEYPLARVISEAGLTQLHIAETEKYAHITYYLNVGQEEPFPGEEQALIRSSGIKNFAEEPHMQAEAITDRVIHELEQGLYDIYFANYANPDMVGHSGNFEATVEACSFVDLCLGRLWGALEAIPGALIITADHGNAEEKINPQTGEMETYHTTNPVPFHYLAPHLRRTTPKAESELEEIFSSPIGVLADVAPTILDILQIPKPPSMTGISLTGSLR